jgi:hypothetical protein
MYKPALLKFALPITILFACSVIPAFAQRGGGSHGGGGGGSHGGGGGFSGGSRGGSFSAPRTGGGGYSRPAPSAPARPSGGSYARPGGNAYQSYGTPVNVPSRGGYSNAAPRGTANGEWQSFGGSPAARGGVASPSEARSSSAPNGGWQSFGGNRAAGTGSIRSFSGQGNQVWENAPTARNVVPSSRTLSSLRGSFGNSLAGASGTRSNGSLSTKSVLPARPSLGNSLNPGAFGFNPARNFGDRFGRFNGGFRGGCWNCGLGFGFWPGWGFGWSGLGFGFGGWCDPFFWDSLTWGCPGYGYGLGYYGYPAAGYPYGYAPYYGNGYSYSTPPDPAQQGDDSDMDQGYGPESNPGLSSALPVMDNDSQTVAGNQVTVPVILYLKDGSAYSVRDYWVSDGQLHYVMLNGSASAFDVDRLDVQRTVDENAKSGVQFVLKPNPSGFAPAPGQAPPSNSPEPAPQINLTLQSQTKS